MKNTIFTGVATALITPFDSNGKIDYKKFAELVEFQINEGINALVVCGTTGEASTLTDDEHKDAISFVVKQTAGRVPVIVGTGSNDTEYAIQLTQHACEAGADAVLVVTPYYNKATQKGLIRMYTEIADASTKPVILYNVPSRTGVAIEPSTYLALADHPNIVAIKEANGNISKIAEAALLVGDKLDIYSGNDDQIAPMLGIGGIGVISVLSNLIPAETSRMCKAFFEGDTAECAKMQLHYLPLINALFSDVNPIPVKEAMALLGACTRDMRAPLIGMDDAALAKLKSVIESYGIEKVSQ